MKYMDNLQVKVFSNFLLDLYCNNKINLVHIYLEIFEILSSKKLEKNNIRVDVFIFEYITKIIIVSIKKSNKSFDFKKHYFEYYKKLLTKFKLTLIKDKVYRSLVLICLTLYKKDFEYKELLKFLQNYEHNLQKDFIEK
jgi:hypothetical protein